MSAVKSDDDGNDLTAPGPDTDVGQLIYLLEWARQRGFQIGPTIQIGNVVVQVRDKRASEQDREPDRDIFEEHGHVEKD